MPVANTLAYYRQAKIEAVEKKFMGQFQNGTKIICLSAL
jgi:hypothetical protein